MTDLYKEILHNCQKGQDLHTRNHERKMDPKGNGWKLQSHFYKRHNHVHVHMSIFKVRSMERHTVNNYTWLALGKEIGAEACFYSRNF